MAGIYLSAVKNAANYSVTNRLRPRGKKTGLVTRFSEPTTAWANSLASLATKLDSSATNDVGTEATPARRSVSLATKRVGWETNTVKLEGPTVRLSPVLRNGLAG